MKEIDSLMTHLNTFKIKHKLNNNELLIFKGDKLVCTIHQKEDETLLDIEWIEGNQTINNTDVRVENIFEKILIRTIIRGE